MPRNHEGARCIQNIEQNWEIKKIWHKMFMQGLVSAFLCMDLAPDYWTDAMKLFLMKD